MKQVLVTNARQRRVNKWLLVGIVSAVLASSFSTAHGQEPNPAITNTPVSSLNVWNVNMELLSRTNLANGEPAWKSVFDRFATHAYLPDLILFQEVPRCDRNGDGSASGDGTIDIIQFLAALRTHPVLGQVTWSYVHANAVDETLCTTHNSGIIWNDARLTATPGEKDVFRPNFNNTSVDYCGQNGHAITALKLRDKLIQRTITAASVHVNVGMGNTLSSSQDSNCRRRVLLEVNEHLEQLAPTRRLSVIGGDINRRPMDDQAAPAVDPDNTGDSEGYETSPNCWYTAMSAAHPGPNCTVVSEADRYYDTVWLAAPGGQTNPTTEPFCYQFTKSRFAGPNYVEGISPNSCTDKAENDGAGDGKLDVSRIDYIWAGWESAAGNAMRPSTLNAAAYVPSAGADSGYSPGAAGPYSDHRAVNAMLQWPAETAT